MVIHRQSIWVLERIQDLFFDAVGPCMEIRHTGVKGITRAVSRDLRATWQQEAQGTCSSQRCSDSFIVLQSGTHLLVQQISII